MALLEKQLVVKISTIPNSGKGLFTKKFIPKGTRIIEYKGKISAWKDVKDEENGYIFYVKSSHVINAKPTPQHLARYANDAKGIGRVKGITNNCNYVTDGLKAYIESIKDIPVGGELFVDYSRGYWKTIRENIRLKKKEEKENAKGKSAGSVKRAKK